MLLSSEEGVDLQSRTQISHSFNGLEHVLALLSFELKRRNVQPLSVESTVLVGDQDDAFEEVDLDQEAKLFRDSFLFPVQRKVPREAGGSSRDCQTIVTWEVKSGFHQVINLLTKTTVAAVDGRSTDTTLVERLTAGKNGLSWFVHFVVRREGRKVSGRQNASGDQAVFCEEPVVIKNCDSRTVRTQSPVVEDQDAFCQFTNGIQIVGGQDQCPGEPGEDAGESTSASWVEVGKRFVERKASRLTGEDTGKACPLSLAKRKPNGVTIGERIKTDVGQGPSDAGLNLVWIQSEVQRAESDITSDGRAEELVLRVLEQQPHPPADLVGVLGGRCQPVDQNRSRILLRRGAWWFREQGVEM